MEEAITRRLEAIVDLGASLALGAAAAWAGARIGDVTASAAAGVLGCALALTFLRRLGPGPMHFRLHDFVPADLPVAVPGELLLTDADRLPVAEDDGPEALLLEDALGPADPDSRVVRLFDPSAMPTPGELRARIDRHLAGPQSAPPDASQALFEALAQLRSSLR